MQKILVLLAVTAALAAALLLWLRPGAAPAAGRGGALGAAGEAPAEGPGSTAAELAAVSPSEARERAAAVAAPGAAAPTVGSAAVGAALAVTVVAPSGTPEDEEVEVLVLTAEFGLGRLLGALDLERDLDRGLGQPTGFDDLQQDEDRLEFQRGAIAARARATRAADGTFRATLTPARDRPLWVAVVGTRLRTPRPVDVPTGASSIQVTPELGGALIVEVGAGPGGAHVADQAVLIARKEGLPGAGVQPAPGNNVRQTRRTGADGRVLVRALPTDAALEVSLFPDEAAPALVGVPALKPGEIRTVTVTLAAAGRVTGLVTDPTGAPIADARVLVLRRGQAFGFDDVELRRGVSDTNGAFAIGGLPTGKVIVRAEHDRWLQSEPAPVELIGAETQGGLTLALREGRRIEGIARFADGRPAAGVDVEARFDVAYMAGPQALGFASGRSGRAQADSEGRFAVRGLGSGPFVVTAEAVNPADTAGAPWRARVDAVKPGVLDLALVLHAPLALAGRVVDDEGAPVGDVEVVALRVTQGALGKFDQTRRTAHTDAEGAFRCEDLLAGDYELVVQSRTHVSLAPLAAKLPDPGAEALLVTAARAAVVRGRVLSPAGGGVGGAEVRVSAAGPDWAEAFQKRPPTARAKSEPDGTFELAGVPPREVALGATSPDWARASAAALTLAPGEVREGVVLTLSNGGAITGEVYDDEGRPAAGRMIQVQRGDGGGARQSSSDGDGRFRVEHIEPGTYQVIAIDLQRMGESNAASSGEGLDVGGMMNSLEMASATVVDGEVVHVVLGAPPSSPVKVAGRVTQAGRPVGSALVTFLPAGPKMMERMKFATTDAEGEYSLVLDEPGDHVVAVQRQIGGIGQQSTAEFQADVAAGETSRHDFELPGGRIAGRIVDADGRGLAGARVSLTRSGGVRTDQLFGGNSAEIQSGVDGTYLLEGLGAGTYRLAAGGASLLGAGAAENGRVVRGGLALGEGESLEGIDLRLPRPGRVAVTVRGKDGAARPGATLFLRDEAGEPLEAMSFLATGEDGRALIEGVAPGRYSLSARTSNEAAGDGAFVTVREGETAEAALTLEAGTIVRVVLKSKAEGARPEGTVQVFDDGGRDLSGIFSVAEVQSGVFGGGYTRGETKLGPVPPGRYRVVFTRGGDTEERRVTLRGEPERVITIAL